MKQMLTPPTGTHFSARLLRSTVVLLTGVALGFALWTATASTSVAQGASPARLIESNLPQGKTLASATKSQLLSAVCAAIRKNRGQAPQIVHVATAARPAWSGDILRTAFDCAGKDDCGLLGRIFREAVAASPDDASALADLAASLAPGCASAFSSGRHPDDLGNYGPAPTNVNPPPGSIGGGGWQGNVVAICHNGRTLFVSPRGAEQHLNNHPGDTLGPCVVTPNQNQ
jgi:hypothetical protein